MPSTDSHAIPLGYEAPSYPNAVQDTILEKTQPDTETIDLEVTQLWNGVHVIVSVYHGGRSKSLKGHKERPNPKPLYVDAIYNRVLAFAETDWRQSNPMNGFVTQGPHPENRSPLAKAPELFPLSLAVYLLVFLRERPLT
jgi:hypothetical protein